jgi:hypothetical protein
MARTPAVRVLQVLTCPVTRKLGEVRTIEAMGWIGGFPFLVGFAKYIVGRAVVCGKFCCSGSVGSVGRESW